MSEETSMEVVATSHPKATNNIKPIRRSRQRPKNNNSKSRSDDSFRRKIGAKVAQDFMDARAKKFAADPDDLARLNLSTPPSFTTRPITPTVKRIPFSTFGIGLTISELYVRFADAFRLANCSIYSLYRCTLAQLDLQRQVSAEGGVNLFPMNQSLALAMSSALRNACKSHPDNFKVLVLIIETFGRFKVGKADYITVIPDIEHSPWSVTITSLPPLLDWLKDPNPVEIDDRRLFFQSNPLPGAIVDDTTWCLRNSEDFWPAHYQMHDIRDDFVSVVRLLENMKTKFELVADKLTYSGNGKISSLISISSPGVAVRLQYLDPEPDDPPASRHKRARVDPPDRRIPIFEPRSTYIPELCWYTSEPMESLEGSLGILAFCGVTSNELEEQYPDYRVRCPYNSSGRITESWNALFDEAIPRVARS